VELVAKKKTVTLGGGRKTAGCLGNVSFQNDVGGVPLAKRKKKKSRLVFEKENQRIRLKKQYLVVMG